MKMLCIGLLISFALLLAPELALATNNAVTPANVWSAWTWDVPFLLGLMFTAWLYNHGLSRLWRRVGFGRGVTYRQVAAFAVALLSLFAALISPLDALSHTLFSAHMAQHMLLVLVAAPLLVVSGLPVAVLAALPPGWGKRLGGFWRSADGLRAAWTIISRPVTTWTLATATIWLWHLPGLYQAALQNDFIHACEHLLFLLTAALFWWTLFRPAQRKHVTYGAHILYLFTATLQGTALGALLTFTGRPWYPAYETTTALWGMTPLQDQQLAGVVMWLPSGMLYLAVTLGFFMAWMRALETHMQSIERENAAFTGGK
jgi:putative membrane protein